MKRKHQILSLVAVGIMAAAGWFGVSNLLSNAFAQGPTKGPLTADNTCPVFKTEYRQCDVMFGNSGLSTLNSLYETFVGEGAFEIDSFEVETFGANRFNIIAQSNRGPITSQIYTDRIVRLGQDRENEIVYRTNQSAFCDAGRIYEHQAVYVDGDLTVQDLEFWTENNKLRFRLFQNGSPSADVSCRS